jgi:hypothetical protein
MNQLRTSSRRCPQCGWAIARIPRRPQDRIQSQTVPIRRYRCCRSSGCGWEGTLLVDNRRDAGLGRERMARLTKNRLVVWAVFAVTVAAAGVTFHGPIAPMSLLDRNARMVPFGVSDFGRPLPESHPFLKQDIDARVVETAAAVATSPSASAHDAPLSLREGCAWGEPGRSPYSGTVRQALEAARLPTEVVALLERKIGDGATSDRLEIRNDKIRGVRSGTTFESRAIKLTYGKTLCLNSRVNFIRGHVERADLYEVADARGITYSVMVPDVCGNISVLGPRGRHDDEAPDIGSLIRWPWRPRGAEGVPNLGRVTRETIPPPTHSVPEPKTWTLMLGGLALLGWFTQRHRRGSSQRTSRAT